MTDRPVLDQPASEADLEACHRIVLDTPLPPGAAARFLHDAPSLGELLRRMLASRAAGRARIRQVGEVYWTGDWGETRIDVDCPPDQLERLLAMVRETWSRLGRNDPLVSVMTNPIYAAKNLTPERRAHFFATGADEAAAFTRICARNGLPARVPRLLDFGCGVGRIGEHLLASTDHYTGVDISAAHLDLARERLGDTAELLLLPDFLAQADRRWDRIVSCLVLQHNPPPVMLWLLRRLLERLAPGGSAILQIPVQRFGYGFDLPAYLADEAPRPMEMHVLPQRHIFRAAAEAGCQVLETFHDGRNSNRGLSYSFTFQRPGATAAGDPA